MRVVVAGLGIQGRKRVAAAGRDVVATVDPKVADATHRRLEDVDPATFDALLACVPDVPKLDMLEYAVEHGKHVLVEKPLFGQPERLKSLARRAAERGVTCYTAYNHRFEPSWEQLKRLVDSGELGRIYSIRLLYGNGTARDVHDSAWRDRGWGVLPDLGSHLLDLSLWLVGSAPAEPRVWAAHRHENRAFDHVIFGFEGPPLIELETSLVCWRNTFRADVIGERGSAHVDGLCKWGGSTCTHRVRKLPSGRPDETQQVVRRPDPTWDHEYRHFLDLCSRGESNLDNDQWINARYRELIAQLPLEDQ